MTETGPDLAHPALVAPSSLGTPPRRRLPVARTCKRGLDIAVSATAAFLLLPLMLLVAGTIWALDGGPPIERETQLGCDGRSFGCLRFRTTEPAPVFTDARSGRGEPGDARRVTAIGHVLNETSLDQLPKLLNVLRGELSLVGARSIPEADGGQHGPGIDLRLSFLPGLTGAGQVEAGPDATEAERRALDLDYVERWSLRRDFAIILRGVADALAGRDRR